MADDVEGTTSDCEGFKKRLAMGFELGSALYTDPHLLSCSGCRELVVDLERIAEEARDLPWRQ